MYCRPHQHQKDATALNHWSCPPTLPVTKTSDLLQSKHTSQTTCLFSISVLTRMQGQTETHIIKSMWFFERNLASSSQPHLAFFPFFLVSLSLSLLFLEFQSGHLHHQFIAGRFLCFCFSVFAFLYVAVSLFLVWFGLFCFVLSFFPPAISCAQSHQPSLIL